MNSDGTDKYLRECIYAGLHSAKENVVIQPTVCAVMITADRPELTRRAVECFRAQSYSEKRLLVWDTSESVESCLGGYGSTMQVFHSEPDGATIGELRNRANAAWDTSWNKHADILIHWDSDDHSHPDRISEQVAFLQQSGAGCVGFNQMLFWREPYLVKNGVAVAVEPTRNPVEYSDGIAEGEAWLYAHPSDCYALGTSLCYYASIWKQRPFEHKQIGEDKAWINGVDTRGISSLGRYIRLGEMDHTAEPRMVARIHGGNTNAHAYSTFEMERNKGLNWKLSPSHNELCRRILA